jgi:hypothetical protein
MRLHQMTTGVGFNSLHKVASNGIKAQPNGWGPLNILNKADYLCVVVNSQPLFVTAVIFLQNPVTPKADYK